MNARGNAGLWGALLSLALAVWPSAAAEPAWRSGFEAQWRAKGRKQAFKTWLRSRRIVVVEGGGGEGESIRAALVEQLAALGGGPLEVRLEPPPAGAPYAACLAAGVLDTRCFGKKVGLLRAEPPFLGSIVVLATDAALDLLPRKNPDGSTTGPPAGRASYPDGWAVISAFWRRRNEAEGRRDWTLADGRGFAAHGREHTARHELGHLLGLSHHEELENPGFSEAPRCKPHEGRHAECLMSCGSADDEWFRMRDTGAGFGLCAKCEAAAKAFLEGLKEGFAASGAATPGSPAPSP